MHHYLLRTMVFGPRVIEDYFNRIPKEKWDTPTAEDRFTPREVVSHLRFWEPIARGRIDQAMYNSGSDVSNWDEERHAVDEDYASKDPHQMLAEWKDERAETWELLQTVPDDAWDNYVIHGMWGNITLDDLANLLIAHDMYHIEQFREFTAG